MSNTLQQAQTPAEHSEVDYGQRLIWRLVGSRITVFGANANGEIFLSTEKNGIVSRIVIGKDDTGDISLYEIEKEDLSNG